MGKIERGEELTQQVNGAIANLQAQLAQGHTQDYLDSLQWFAKLHKYSWGNALLIASQCPSATVVAGYKRWQELGFQVKKGETGLSIRAPWLRKEVDPTTGEKKERLTGYFATVVFDISQTQEYPEKQPPAFCQELPGDFTALYEHLVCKVAAMGISYEERPLPTGYQGHFEVKTRKIVISDGLSTYLKATTLIHEVVHATVHSTKEDIQKWSQNEREWQAESICYTVCAAIGMENVNSANYLLGYALTTDKLAELIQFIQKTTKQVLAHLDLLQPVKVEEAALAAD
jgi:antirestriction protein ArdC